jgi:photosystem II stability/assembly factor-like uncharacterized protein
LLRTDDGGSSWYPVLEYPGPTPDQPQPVLSALAVWGNDLSQLIVGLRSDGQSVLRSVDGGATWDPLRAQAIGDVQQLAVDPAADLLYAATTAGVWRMRSPHLGW